MFALFFDVSKEAMTARIMARGKTSGRSDDNMEALVRRASLMCPAAHRSRVGSGVSGVSSCFIGNPK